jgi:hypothetical protein
MVFWCTAVYGQGPAGVLKQPIEEYDVRDAEIVVALRHLHDLVGDRVVFGLERVAHRAEDTAETKITIHIEHGTLGEVLKQICDQDPRYQFSDEGSGVINIRPGTEAPQSATVLDLPLVGVEFRVREWPGTVIGRLPDFVPELRTYLDARAREYHARTSRPPRGSPGITMSTNVPPPEMKVEIKRPTVRGLLNALAAYTLAQAATGNSSRGAPIVATGWEFDFILDADADTGLGGYPRWKPFPFP